MAAGVLAGLDGPLPLLRLRKLAVDEDLKQLGQVERGSGPGSAAFILCGGWGERKTSQQNRVATGECTAGSTVVGCVVWVCVQRGASLYLVVRGSG